MKFNRTNLLLLLLISLLIGTFTDYVFTDKIFGLNFLLWVALWIGYGLLIGLKRGLLGYRQYGYIIFALTGALMVYFRAEPIVQLWSSLISLVSVGNLFASISIQNNSLLTITQRWVQLPIEYFRSVGIMSALTRRSANVSRLHWQWIISGAFSVIFIGLFSSSDNVFGSGFSWVSELADGVFSWFGGVDFARIFSLLFWTIVSLLALLLLLKPAVKVTVSNIALSKVVKSKDRLTILVPLLLIFSAYVLVQLVYLFGGTNLPGGVSYAEYARGGYGELILATTIAGGVVYVTQRMSKSRDSTSDRMGIALLLLNLVVVASAWKRLSLYEDAYGWTISRFVARLGLVCIALGIVLMILYGFQKISSAKLFALSWYVVAIVLSIAAILNPAGLVASKNINDLQSREVPLDTVYLLNGLSTDSYQAICNNLDTVKQNDPEKYYQILNRRAVGSSMISGVEYYIDENVGLDNKNNQGLSRHWVYSEAFKKSASCFNY